jgi:O-antigen ligase
VGRIVSDYPLGVGARGFHVLIPKYSAELAERHQGEERAPHNTVIMVATEYGVAGIMFWLAFYAAVFWTLLKTRRLCLTAGNDGLYIRTVAITVGLVGSLVASLFSDRLYSEGIYWIVSMAIAVNRVSRIEHETARTAVVPLRAA